MTIRKFTATNGQEYSIDSARMSTGKQRYAVACRFWNEFLRDEMNVPETARATAKTMIGRIKNSISAFHDMQVTDGDIQKYFKIDKIPAGIMKLIKIDELEKQTISDGLEVKKVTVKATKKSSKNAKKVAITVAPTNAPKVSDDDGMDAILAICKESVLSPSEVFKALKSDG